MKGRNWLLLVIIVLLVVCVAMLVFYFYNVTNHFSTDSNDWGNFGGYLGSITGILAFAGVLYSIQQSSKAHTEDSQRGLFIQLLGLYQKQVDSLFYDGESGAKAFQKYLSTFEDYFYHINDSYNKQINAIMVRTYTYDILYSRIHSCYNSLFEENEHILGQYFRTVYYLLDTIKDFKNKEQYSRIFRSQLSRYELVLLLYNSIGSKSNLDVIQLYKDNDIFNNLEFDDLPKIDIATYKTRDGKEEAKKKYIEELFICFKQPENNASA